MATLPNTSGRSADTGPAGTALSRRIDGTTGMLRDVTAAAGAIADCWAKIDASLLSPPRMARVFASSAWAGAAQLNSAAAIDRAKRDDMPALCAQHGKDLAKPY